MPSFERWHDAMMGYRSGIALDRQHAIGALATGFAYYLNGVHNRVHPWFTDRFLVSLGKLPKDDPINAPKLVATVELAVAPDGHIAQMGIVRSSGIPALDASGLEAFSRAVPFEATPPDLRSWDGNVWMTWQLHRDEVFSCSTIGARPYVLGP